eukprot:gene1326-372_t
MTDGNDIPKAGPPPLLLFVTQVQDAKTVWVEISVNDTVSHLKTLVERKTGIEKEHQELVFDGNALVDEHKIADCSNEVTIHLGDKRNKPEDCAPDPVEQA